jgi:hypothetical protein
MEEERLTPELEKLLKQVRLKEPSQELMADYLTGVNAKIERRMSAPHFGFREGVLVFAVGLILAGLFYFLLAPSLNHEPTPEIQPVIARHDQIEPEAISEIASLPPQSASDPPRILAGPTVARNDERIPEVDLSLEEELALLEAFEEELSEQESDWLEDEELLEELALLDELELSSPSTGRLPSTQV